MHALAQTILSEDASTRPNSRQCENALNQTNAYRSKLQNMEL